MRIVDVMLWWMVAGRRHPRSFRLQESGAKVRDNVISKPKLFDLRSQVNRQKIETSPNQLLTSIDWTTLSDYYH
jgi:hypothetical protein